MVGCPSGFCTDLVRTIISTALGTETGCFIAAKSRFRVGIPLPPPKKAVQVTGCHLRGGALDARVAGLIRATQELDGHPPVRCSRALAFLLQS